MTARAQSADLAIDLILEAARLSRRAVEGKVLGVVGEGALGRQIACRAVHCGMEVLYSDAAPGAGPYRRVMLGELLARSDFVLTLHREAANTLRDNVFVVLMKPDAQLIELATPP